MARAIFVNLKHLWPQLDAKCQGDQNSFALRCGTCGWWKVNPEHAGDIRYAFGVVGGVVVSAYAVGVPVDQWPVMPAPALDGGRRYIACARLPLSPQSWARALQWRGIVMAGPIRYGEVFLDANGELDRVEVPASPVHSEEEPEEQG